jgi:hypothetical protein
MTQETGVSRLGIIKSVSSPEFVVGGVHDNP